MSCQRVEIEIMPAIWAKKEKKRNLTSFDRRLDSRVLYGHGEPVSVAVNARAFDKAIHGKAGTNALFHFKFGKTRASASIKEVQRHYLKHNPITLTSTAST